MTFDNLVFWLIAVPLTVVSIVLAGRYARANQRWFSQLVKVESSRPVLEQEPTARVLRKFPKRPSGLYQFAYAILLMFFRGPLFMFREDHRHPEVEALRREAVARYRPIVAIVVVGAGIWLIMFTGILVFLTVKHIV